MALRRGVGFDNAQAWLDHLSRNAVSGDFKAPRADPHGSPAARCRTLGRY
jgi:hypothetical protein